MRLHIGVVRIFLLLTAFFDASLLEFGRPIKKKENLKNNAASRLFRTFERPKK